MGFKPNLKKRKEIAFSPKSILTSLLMFYLLIYYKWVCFYTEYTVWNQQRTSCLLPWLYCFVLSTRLRPKVSGWGHRILIWLHQNPDDLHEYSSYLNSSICEVFEQTPPHCYSAERGQDTAHEQYWILTLDIVLYLLTCPTKRRPACFSRNVSQEWTSFSKTDTDKKKQLQVHSYKSC